MQILLQQSDIELALRQYLEREGINREVHTINFTAKRQGSQSVEAEIHLATAGSAPELKAVPDTPEPPKATTQAPKAEKPTKKAEKASKAKATPAPEEVKEEAPPAEETASTEAETTAPEEVGEKKSIFG